jgi:hypothetical protein
MFIAACIICVLLLLYVFKDSSVVMSLRNAVSPDSGVKTTNNPGGETETFTAADNYEILPDPLFKSEGFMNSRESHNTWEPSTVDFAKLDNDTLYKSYSEDLKANVDQAIVESHREYVKDTDFLATTGASHQSARDDFMPAVQFHGLPRTAHYAALGSESSARTSQSETPEEAYNIATSHSSGYII